MRCARAAVDMWAARTAAPVAAPTPAPRESAAAAPSARTWEADPSASACLDTRYSTQRRPGSCGLSFSRGLGMLSIKCKNGGGQIQVSFTKVVCYAVKLDFFTCH